MGTNLSDSLEFLCDPIEDRLAYRSIDGHTYVHLGGRDEIDDDTISIKGTKDPREEAVGDGLAIRADGEDENVVLDRHCGGSPPHCLRRDGRVAGPRARCAGLVDGFGFTVQRGIGEDDGASSRWVLDVLDSDGDGGADDLFHRERVDDFGSVVGQFGGLFWCDHRK